MYYNTKTKEIISSLPTHHTFAGSSQLGEDSISSGCSTGEFHLWDSKYHIAEGFLPLEEIKPEYNEATHTLHPSEVTITGDGKSARRTWVVMEKTDNQIAEETLSAWQSVRDKRNNLLKQSDWTQLADVPANPDWVTYRQTLRDITELFDTPDTVIWPEKPK